MSEPKIGYVSNMRLVYDGKIDGVKREYSRKIKCNFGDPIPLEAGDKITIKAEIEFFGGGE